MAVQNNKAEGTVLLEMKHVKKSFDKSGVLKDISLSYIKLLFLLCKKSGFIAFVYF